MSRCLLTAPALLLLVWRRKSLLKLPKRNRLLQDALGPATWHHRAPQEFPESGSFPGQPTLLAPISTGVRGYFTFSTVGILP